MSRHAIQLITVSREFGAGGGAFASELGARLGWPVLDRDIVHRIAERLRMEDTTVERFAEHPPSLLARIASFLVIPHSEMYEFPAVEGLPTHDEIALASTSVIQQACASLPLVVVGHGSQCIFAGRPDALHVFLHGPLGARTRRIIERFHVNPAAAPALVRHADLERAAYVQRYFHTDWRSDPLYDVQINTAKIAVGEAVTMVERLVREHVPAAAEVKAGDPGPGGVHAG